MQSSKSLIINHTSRRNVERNQSRGNSLFWCDGGEWPSLAKCSVSSTNEVTVKINMKREGGRERWREGVGPGTTRWIDKRAPCLPWQVQFKTPTAQPTTTNRQADLYHTQTIIISYWDGRLSDSQSRHCVQHPREFLWPERRKRKRVSHSTPPSPLVER